jgi:hypothetical protein
MQNSKRMCSLKFAKTIKANVCDIKKKIFHFPFFPFFKVKKNENKNAFMSKTTREKMFKMKRCRRNKIFEHEN